MAALATAPHSNATSFPPAPPLPRQKLVRRVCHIPLHPSHFTGRLYLSGISAASTSAILSRSFIQTHTEPRSYVLAVSQDPAGMERLIQPAQQHAGLLLGCCTEKRWRRLPRCILRSLLRCIRCMPGSSLKCNDAGLRSYFMPWKAWPGSQGLIHIFQGGPTRRWGCHLDMQARIAIGLMCLRRHTRRQELVRKRSRRETEPGPLQS